MSRNLSPGVASFKWTALGSCDFVVCVRGLPSKESPSAGIGRVRKRLGSSQVRIENNKNSRKNRRKPVEGA